MLIDSQFDEKVHLFDGEATDFTLECQKFEKQIAKVGGVEFMFLGA